tara:strand:+ start:37 stop:1341 length:1305 start_codon:yes stop_codon:yes gene_type:complete
MAKYPFKINIIKGDGSQVSYYTSSFANSGMTFVSSSEIVTRINAIPLGDSFLQSEEAVATSSGNVYNDSGQGATFLSVSTNDAMSGSITFTDTETTTNGGLDNYTFFGTKVCSTLGLPEGIPIYTENFRLSDDSNNPDNYLSGDVIADSVSIKTGFKMSPQGRMRSNLVWDEIFGEGILQWVSGSTSRLRIGYDDVDDKYILKAATSPTFEISGVDTYSGGTIQCTTVTANISTSDIDNGSAIGIGDTNSPGVALGRSGNSFMLYNTGGDHNFQTGDVVVTAGALGVGTSTLGTAGLIRATNDVVAFYSSDERLKDNLIKIGNPLDKISQLNGYEFDWIVNQEIHPNEGHDVGVIAQEVEKVIPEIVETRESGYKAVKYEKIVPLLIEAIKEQQVQIDELKENSHEPQNYKEQCEKLKKELDKLKQEVEELKNG